MIKNALAAFLIILNPLLIYAQDNGFEPHGNAFATIFANFHYGVYGAARNNTAFELARGYIGYEHYLSPEFYAKVNVDIGSPDDLSPRSRMRRYAYFKNAYLRYQKSSLTIDFGLISLKQNNVQERIWERRYLMKSLADEYNLGSSADLGVNFNFAFNDFIDADFTIMNGEGYNSLQMDNIFKYSLGTTIKLPENFTSRVFFDFTRNKIYETTLLLFVSYDYNKKWNLAGEYIIRNNEGWNSRHNRNALSVYGKYNITTKYQLFARYDVVRSDVLESESVPWNLSDDGSALVAGIQYNPIKNIKMALNYHDWCPWAANSTCRGLIYLNLEVKL
ncbi:MAG: porin [Draconibacterium sp.]|nr:MAG: porin [Draconibacterium sp.]